MMASQNIHGVLGKVHGIVKRISKPANPNQNTNTNTNPNPNPSVPGYNRTNVFKPTKYTLVQPNEARFSNWSLGQLLQSPSFNNETGVYDIIPGDEGAYIIRSFTVLGSNIVLNSPTPPTLDILLNGEILTSAPFPVEMTSNTYYIPNHRSISVEFDYLLNVNDTITLELTAPSEVIDQIANQIINNPATSLRILKTS